MNFFDPDGRIVPASSNHNVDPGVHLTAGEFFGAAGSGSLHGAEAFSDGVTGVVGAHPFANNGFYDQNDPSLQISRKIGTATAITEATLPFAVAGGEALLGAYKAGSIGTTVYVTSNAALGSAVSVVNSAANQLVNTGTINTGELESSAKLGFALGGLSGGLGYWAKSSANAVTNLTTQAVDYEVSAALRTQFWQYGAADTATANMNSVLNWYTTGISQAAANASISGMALDLREILFPAAEYGIDQWADAASEENSSGESSQSGSHCSF